jgi:dihydropyrimidine dehydrogenase (NAD+) subunit PreT
LHWIALTLPLAAAFFLLAAQVRRRLELREQAEALGQRGLAKSRGSHDARLQYPDIDLDRCIGCGGCVRACPEDGVLGLAYGQAVVLHGARCVGHGQCAAACPTGAIALTLADLANRRDLPAIDPSHEAVGRPGLFLAGEITGFALVRTAVTHGALVAREAARRLAELPPVQGEALDLAVVGLGPAGLSCLLAAKQQGLRAVGIDQAAEIGGTVAAYPRHKLVLTQPMELPLHGRLDRLDYEKEELTALWRDLAREHDLPVRLGETLRAVERAPDGAFVLRTDRGELRARTVCLALGRRGSPKKLGVPGEELPKVAYALLDAQHHQGQRILVVGGGDSAVEAALALAEQPGNEVALSYRRAAFSRLKARNEARIAAAAQSGTVRLLLATNVVRITADAVDLTPTDDGDDGTRTGDVAVQTQPLTLPNDEVFVFAGGTPPFPLLEQAGVSFDPADRPRGEPAVDRQNGLVVAIAAVVFGLLGLLAVRLVGADYYDLPPELRPGSPRHHLLRPQGAIGLAAGLLATLSFAANLAYLVRRSPRLSRALPRWLLPGSLRTWMNAHIVTGLSAAMLAVLHSGFSLRSGPGGHALLAMLVVVAAGVIGRWFYSFVPRRLNGRQRDLEEVTAQLAAIAGEWDQHTRGFGGRVHDEVERLVDRARGGAGLFGRLAAMQRSRWLLRRSLAALRADARAEGIPPREVRRLELLARRSHHLSLQLANFDELRHLLAGWRWLHRWLALLLLLVLVVHVVQALRYGDVDFARLFGEGDR